MVGFCTDCVKQQFPQVEVSLFPDHAVTQTVVIHLAISAWIRVEILAPLGKKAAGMYQLTVTVPGEEPKKFEGLSVGSADWRSLRWLGFISLANAKTVIYLDDVKLDLHD